MLILALGCATLLAVVWLLYPLIIGVLARVRPGAPAPLGRTGRRVSVIVATRDHPELVRARVADVLAGSYPAELLEVVVALDPSGSADCAAIDLPFPVSVVRCVRGDRPGGKAATLNAAVRAARGDILVFTDTAQRFRHDAILRLVEALGDERLAAVSGALQIGSDGRISGLAEWYWIYERWIRRQESRVHSTIGVTGAIYALRRERWEPLPPGLILDDVYGPMRLVLEGHRVGFCEEAIAFDDRRFPAAQEYRRKVRTLTGNIQLCAWLPAILVPWRNPIWLQFVCHKLLRLLTPYLLTIAVLAGATVVPPLIGRVLGERWVPVLGLLVASVCVLGVLSARVREAFVTGVAMQAAVVQATINGVRGRWDVWSR